MRAIRNTREISTILRIQRAAGTKENNKAHTYNMNTYVPQNVSSVHGTQEAANSANPATGVDPCCCWVLHFHTYMPILVEPQCCVFGGQLPRTAVSARNKEPGRSYV